VAAGQVGKMNEKDDHIRELTREQASVQEKLDEATELNKTMEQSLEQVELALAEANKKLDRKEELANLTAYLTTLRNNPPQQQHRAVAGCVTPAATATTSSASSSSDDGVASQ
jgi:chromosome segregation ATPase